MVASGKVKIGINHSYRLSDAPQAHRDVEARKTTGSVVLIPEPSDLSDTARSGTIAAMQTTTRQKFRAMLKPGSAVILPGVANALAARVVADCGFEAAYVTGAGIANTFLGIPDNGLVTRASWWRMSRRSATCSPDPLMVDADTGFGNALNMRRTIQTLERAGADAIQIEDQVFPKRCGHFEGKEVIPAAEMVAKIKAAVDARTDPDLLIVARTDAIAVEGFATAMERAHAFREAGADIGFVEAPTTPEQIAAIGRLPWPQLVNIVIGGKTPERSNDGAEEAGLRRRALRQHRVAGRGAGHAARARPAQKNGQMGDATDLLRPSPSGSGWSTSHRSRRWSGNTNDRAHAGADRRRRAGRPGARRRARLARRTLHARSKSPTARSSSRRWTWSASAPWSSAGAGASSIWVRDAPYPLDYPQDYIYVTGLNGYELGREPFPGRGFEPCPPESPQKRERVPQDMFDPILRRFAERSGTRRRCATTANSFRFTETPDGVQRRGARHRDRQRPRPSTPTTWSAPTAAPAPCASSSASA